MQDVVILRRGPRTPLGDPAGDAPTEISRPGAFTAPVASIDGDDRATDTAREELDLYDPDVNVVIAPSDQVSIDGIIYEVGGAVRRWSNPKTGRAHGAVVKIWRAVT